MIIISSVFTLGPLQKNGTNYVTEIHTGDNGMKYIIEYGPIGRVDYRSIMQNRSIIIQDEVNTAEQEKIATNITNSRLAIALWRDINLLEVTEKEVLTIFSINQYSTDGTFIVLKEVVLNGKLVL